jgi:hypothetical protein
MYFLLLCRLGRRLLVRRISRYPNHQHISSLPRYSLPFPFHAPSSFPLSHVGTGTYPKGPSCKHNSGNPIEEIAAIFPTQGPFCQPIPVANATLFAFVSLASAVCALVYAEAQLPSPAAARIGAANTKVEERRSMGCILRIEINRTAKRKKAARK